MAGSHDAEHIPHLSFVTGGARSGKSALALRLALAGPAPHLYLATAEDGAADDELRARIARHRADRGGRLATIEAPRNLAPVLAAAHGTVLVDCATLWLTNVVLAGGDAAAEGAALLAAIGACPARVVVVSNEVGSGIVPDNALARAFRDEQGRLNQRLAAAADLAVLVVAGLPLVLKGRLPGGLA